MVANDKVVQTEPVSWSDVPQGALGGWLAVSPDRKLHLHLIERRGSEVRYYASDAPARSLSVETLESAEFAPLRPTFA